MIYSTRSLSLIIARKIIYIYFSLFVINGFLYGTVYVLYKNKADELDKVEVSTIVSSLTHSIEATVKSLISQEDFFNLLVSNNIEFNSIPKFRKYMLINTFSSNLFSHLGNSIIGYKILNNSFELFNIGESSSNYISYDLSYSDDVYNRTDNALSRGLIYIFFDKQKLEKYLSSKGLVTSSFKGQLLQQIFNKESSMSLHNVDFPNIYIKSYSNYIDWKLVVIFLLSFVINIFFILYIVRKSTKYYKDFYITPILEIYNSLSNREIVKKQKYYAREIQRLISVINKAKVISKLDTLSQIEHDLKPAFIQLQELASKLEDYNKKYIIAISEYIRMALSNKNNGISTENLSYVIGQLLNSTYFSYSEIIDFDYDRNSFSRVDRIIFSRIISNLINNSIAANKNKIDFRIKITTKVSFGNVYVLIKDNGVGIPRENIEKIFEKGYSLNGSSGTGLFFCREEVRKCGGDIFCYSDAKKTEFKIKLPLCNSAYNYIDSIYINNKSKIIIVDDEYPEYFKNIEGMIHYNSYLKDELSVAEYFKLSNIDRSNDIYLIDYNFSRDFSGLDIIKKYNLIGQAYIITTIADNIRQSISEEYKEQIPVFDKSMANFIQVKNVRLFDYFVLEDDMLICKIMNDKAKSNKQKILIVNNFLQFNMLKKVISKNDNLVLDINIEGSRIQGDQYIKQLKEEGFLSISVQTGYSNLNLGEGVRIIEKGSF